MLTLYACVCMGRLDKPIRISEDTREKLNALKRGRDNYDDVIIRLLEHYGDRDKP